MKFFFPDSQDLVDPSFDFNKETRSALRVRHQDDCYAHEMFRSPPYDGILVSKAMIEGTGGGGGRYTMAQRQRFQRVGVREFFRISNLPLETMGDCGAFSYVGEPVPPVSTDEVIGFYDGNGFDFGVSVDHIIGAYRPEVDESLPGIDLVPEDWRNRQEITLELAREFRRKWKRRKCRFNAIGVAQGWSPFSYSFAVKDLQKMGYRRIAIGGLVPLKTEEIVAILEGVSTIRRPETQFHLFGVTRSDQFAEFQKFGVTSFDSTSPLRQAFKDDRDNYYTAQRTYSAIRVPQVEGNPKLRKRILAGEVKQEEATRLEQSCLRALIKYDNGGIGLPRVLKLLLDYEAVHNGQKGYSKEYREILEDRPWKKCRCDICKALGIHVVLFRGAERNRRRGFHNVFVVYQRLRRGLQRRKVKRAK